MAPEIPAPNRLFLQHTHQIQTGLQGLATGLPLSGTDLVAVLTDELAGLQLAEQLVGVAADIAGAHFIRNDLSLGIDDESAALGQTVRLDENIKIPADGI